jgi:threonine aldolase
VHLDGARLWEAAPYYATKKKTIADVAGLFDSVYVSFYKGLGGIAGCCVAGETDVVEELSVWRTRHGGRTFMMWPYAASALTVLRERPQLMAKYYQRARAIARSIRDIPGIEVMPDPVQSPLMHIRIAASKTEIRRRVLAIAKRDGVMTLPNLFSSDGPTLQRFEFQVGAATMTFSVNEITALFRRLASARTR